jgi:hypothetical protein
MGDPTLRLHPVPPVTELTPAIRGSNVRLTWKEPEADVEGYLVYRLSPGAQLFARRTETPLRELSFVDDNVPPGDHSYMVRVVRLQVSGSGTYFNLSAGVTRTVSVGGAPDTAPPSVKLVAPTPGSDIYPSAEFVASVRDDRGIAKVEFLVDGTLAATVVEEPFSFRWNPDSVSPGQHFITVQATDYAGNTAQDRMRVNLVRSDTTAPSVSITEPAAGRRVWGNIIVRASARDNAALDRVELRVDDQLLGTARTEPYDFIWKTCDSDSGSQTVSDGVHRLRATAFDRSGNRADSIVAVTVDSALSRPAILPASPAKLVAQPGQVVELTHHWQGGPARQECLVFTHFVADSGRERSPTLTLRPFRLTTGPVTFLSRQVPHQTHPGPGEIQNQGGPCLRFQPAALDPGPGVVADDQNRFEIGMLTVMPDTTPPKLVFSTWKPGQKIRVGPGYPCGRLITSLWTTSRCS